MPFVELANGELKNIQNSEVGMVCQVAEGLCRVYLSGSVIYVKGTLSDIVTTLRLDEIGLVKSRS